MNIDAFLNDGRPVNTEEFTFEIGGQIADASGFGLRAFLKLIIEILRSNHQVMLIEEPEIHLHPEVLPIVWTESGVS